MHTRWKEEVYDMKKNPNLVCQNLITIDDYLKQRTKSKNDFDEFVQKRNASRVTCINTEEEKKRM